jgi:predicted O-methyltransferase YrrM
MADGNAHSLAQEEIPVSGDERHERGPQQLTQMLADSERMTMAQESDIAPDPASFATPNRWMSPSRSLGPFRRVLRTPWIRLCAARMFRTCQKLGFNVTPRHFYYPIPDLDLLSEKDWTAWAWPDAVSLSLDSQLRLLESGLLPFFAERCFPEHATERPYEFHFNNGFFERVDAEIAYAMVRYLLPRKIVEIGSGQSTRVLATALCRNREEGRNGELLAIEPHPDAVLRRGFPGLTKLEVQRVQDVPLEVFTGLERGDILFIDSSHVVAMDSDVIHEYLRILPKLKPGVVIHVHDVFLPADYPKKFVMTNLCFWGEQYLLEAFLSYNQAFQILWASSAMQLLRPAELEQFFPAWKDSYLRIPEFLRIFTPTLDGRKVWPCSFWIEKVAA